MRLGIRHQDPLTKGYFLTDRARIISGDKGYSVELKAKAEGLLEADLLYGKHSQLKTGFFSCPEDALFEPYKMNFLKAYEIKRSLRIESEAIDKKWDKIIITIHPFWIDEYSKKYNLSLLAYCLMDNRVHFIAIPRKEESLAKVLSITHKRHAQYFNKNNNISGHLWQGFFIQMKTKKMILELIEKTMCLCSALL